jgi:long-chain acyl-CoA synthetase
MLNDIYSTRPWLKSYDSHVPATLVFPDKSFIDLFRDVCKSMPRRVAIYYMNAALTYEQLDKLSNRFANFLVQQGIERGDIVGLHMPSHPGFHVCLLGAQKVGCAVQGVSLLLSEKELSYQLNDSGAKALCTFDAFYGKIKQVVPSTKVRLVTVLESPDFLPAFKKTMGKMLKKFPQVELTAPEGILAVKLSKILKTVKADPINIEIDPESMCLLMYTGGTTGPSKGAMLTNRNIVSHYMQQTTWFDVKAGKEVLAPTFPFFHVGGMFSTMTGLMGGATQIMVPNPRDHKYLISVYRKYRVTMISNIPTTYINLMKNPAFKPKDYKFVRAWTSGGAPFPTEYMKPFNAAIGKSIVEHYGLTESTSLLTANPLYGTKKVGSIGIPLQDTEAKVINPDTGELCKPGEPGELCCRGPQIMKGYFNKPEETANAIKDGWLHTGDVVIMDEEGYLTVVDRLKDMVSVSGMKVFTGELDEVICTHPDISLAASIGIPDPERPFTEIVASAIILRPNIEKSDLEKEKIISYLKSKVALYKVPKRIVFVDALPLTPIGKVLKRELRDSFK